MSALNRLKGCKNSLGELRPKKSVKIKIKYGAKGARRCVRHADCALCRSPRAASGFRSAADCKDSLPQRIAGRMTKPRLSILDYSDGGGNHPDAVRAPHP